MSKQKYQFNLESLTFTKVKRGLTHYLLLVLRYFLASVALATVSYIIYSFFTDTPRERQLAQDNLVLEDALTQLNERYQQVSAVLEDIRQRDDNIYRTLFESEPVHTDEQEGERVISYLYQQVKRSGADSIVDRTERVLQHITTEISDVSQRFDTLVAIAQHSQQELGSFPSILPVAYSSTNRIAAPFGMRIHPFYKVLKMHTGIDFTASVGTTVRVTANGVVKRVVSSNRGYGNMLIVEHGNGYSTLYAHLERIQVREGQHIKIGDAIATVGNSGMSMAPHLHYEVLLNKTPVDPLHYFFSELNPTTLADMAQRALQSGQSLD